MFFASLGFAQENQIKDFKKYSVDFSPMSPFIRIYGVQLGYKLNPKNELLTGLAYTNLHLDPGVTHSPSVILGYRRYLWRNLHIEYQIWPSYDNFYAYKEDAYFKSFDIWNEFRFGYQFNFKIKDKSLYTSVQWPFGFGLYSTNKPQSFKEHEEKEKFFYQFPLWFIGIKF